MLIHRLKLVNFRQHEYTDLSFGSGLTGIIGPNGAGKTTLLEAIAWAMYGMRAARGNRDTIRRRGAPPRSRVEVELEFSLGAHTYRIVRSLNSAELFQDGEASAIANSIDAVTDKVTRMLGMNRDEFFNTYFTGQKELAVMAAMTAGERGQFLSRVLGYEKLRVAQDRLRGERSALRARLETLRSGLPDPEVLAAETAAAAARLKETKAAHAKAVKAQAVLEAKHAELGPRWQAARKEREVAARHETDLKLAEQGLNTANVTLKRLKGELAEAEKAAARVAELTRALAPLAGLREQLAALSRDAEGNARRAALGAERKALEARRAELAAIIAEAPDRETRAAAVTQLQTLRDALAFSTAQLEERRTQWVQDRQEAHTKHQALRDQYRELAEQREQIVKAGPEGACPTCGRPLGKDFKTMLGVLDRQMEAVTQDGSFYRARTEQLKDAPPELAVLEKQVQELQKQLEDTAAANSRMLARHEAAEQSRADDKAAARRLKAVEKELAAAPGAVYDEAAHAKARSEVSRLEPLALEAERQRALAERGAAVRKALAQTEATRAEGEALIKSLKEAIAALGFSEPRYRKLEKDWTELEAARQEGQLAVVRAEAEVTAATRAVEVLEQRRLEREERVKEADRVALALRVNQELDAALGDLRTELNTTLRPDVSELASVFLRELTNGRYTDLELDEDYAVRLVDDGEAKGVISGGEEDVANLALRLAISQMIAERAGQPLSLLVLDEIFGSLDDDRRAAVVELLRGLADRFPQVILITHIDTVRDGFDRIIRVSYDPRNGVAVAEDEPMGGHDVAA
jgi:exonuclease SbcC